MKLSLLFKLVLILVLFYASLTSFSGNGIGLSEASQNISRDRVEYIKQQFTLRNQDALKQLNSLSGGINDYYASQKKEDNIFFISNTILNLVSGVATIFGFPVIGGAAKLAVVGLDILHKFIDRSQQGDIGYIISRGVKGVVDKEISSFNAKDLGGIIGGIKDKMNDFYSIKMDGQFDIFLQSTLIDDDFIEKKAEFQKSDFVLDTIGLFTLYANSHLIFLYDMVSNGPEYNFTTSQIKYYEARLDLKITEYRVYIDQVDSIGSTSIERNIKANNIKYHDEWNKRNEHYNFMKLFVYDISNYWDFLNNINYPNGMFIENAHVSLSNLFGSPMKGSTRMTAVEIDSYLSSFNLHQFQGRLKGIYYKNYNCRIDGNNFNLVKYFGGRQYFYREHQERDTTFMGDEGKLAGPKQYIDLGSGDSVIQFLVGEGKPKSFSKDYHWGLSINSTHIGDVSVYTYKNIISYPEKSIASALPISYGKCSIGCSGKEKSDYLVESAVIGFVNRDVIYDNIVFELTGSMIDAQKYHNYSSNGNFGLKYSRDGYKKYKHSILIQSNTRVTYKLNYNPFDNSVGNFKIQVDFRSDSSNPNVNFVLVTSSSNSSSLQEIHKQINSCGKGQIYDIDIINLYPTINNYITIEFSETVYLSSLILIAI